MKKHPGFKYTKFIFCLMDATIVLLIAAFIFKLSQTNSQIQNLSSLLEDQLKCDVCGGRSVDYQEDSCCMEIINGQCVNWLQKKQCKKQLLEAMNKQASFCVQNLTTLLALGCVFIVLEYCCEPCLGLTTKNLNKYFYKKEDSRLLKSGGMSTVQLQAGSSSSLSSFSSFNDNLNYPNRGVDVSGVQSYFYQRDEMACPICLETMEHQKVVALECKHIIHSNCAKKKGVKCPICQ